MELLNAGFATYLLILLAEFGDKSQVICLVLAARHRPWPVFFGAVLAFVLLTGLAVTLGATLNAWIPPALLQFLVAAAFVLFGLQMLLHPHADEDEFSQKSAARSIFASTFALIALSEMGDKTQLAVVGLSTVEPASSVFVGATLALITTSALGVWAGSRLLNPGALKWIHRIGAVLFLAFALLAAYRGYLLL